ncbi:MAG: hypothetical protein VX438_09765 [Planctomycetota bacterium]|jgi:hypothetical protein|nr:hypothetical protein [Planctomycetota bacterium]
MGQNSQPVSSSVFSINVSAEGEEVLTSPSQDDSSVAELLQRLLAGQEKQNELLEEMVETMNANQRQRSAELGHWKQSNPQLSERCRRASEILSDVQTEFLESLTGEIEYHSDSLLEGDFMLNEFVDRFGPRLAHLNGVLQVLSQLSSVPKSLPEED